MLASTVSHDPILNTLKKRGRSWPATFSMNYQHYQGTLFLFVPFHACQTQFAGHDLLNSFGVGSIDVKLISFAIALESPCSLT